MSAPPITLTTNPLTTGYSIDPASFVRVVYQRGTPAIPEEEVWRIARAVDKYAREFSYDGRAMAGQMFEETNYFQYTGDVGPDQHNYGGLGATGGGVKGNRYGSPEEGVLAMFAHASIYFRGKKEYWPTTLQPFYNASKRYDIVVAAGKAGVCRVIGDLGNGNWAEAGDTYPREIVARGNLVAVSPGEPVARTLKLVVGAGHRNTSGGNARERQMTATLTHAYVVVGREWGVDVRSYTPNDGLGEYPGSLGAAVREVTKWAQQGWVADMLVENHFQGLSEGSNAGRGVFTIYPDWDNDIDVDVRDRFRPIWVPEFTARTGVPAYGNGGMSEKRTAVGATGNRLGVFSQSVGLKATTTRMIIEHGCHTCPADLALIQRDGFNRGSAEAFFTAWFKMEGLPLPVPPQPQPYDPSGPGIALTNQWNNHSFYIVGPFYKEYQSLGENFFPVYGLVASGMIRAHVDGVLRYVQFTERGCMALYPPELPHGVSEDNPFFVRNLLPHERAAALEETQELGLVYQDLR